jgi:hypothetical protein
MNAFPKEQPPKRLGELKEMVGFSMGCPKECTVSTVATSGRSVFLPGSSFVRFVHPTHIIAATIINSNVFIL